MTKEQAFEKAKQLCVENGFHPEMSGVARILKLFIDQVFVEVAPLPTQGSGPGSPGLRGERR